MSSPHPAPLPQEKAPEMRGLLTPPPVGLPVPGYASVYQPTVYVNPQERPRNACRRRFWHFTLCSLMFFFGLHLLLHQSHRFRSVPWFGDGAVSGKPEYSPSICEETVNWTRDSTHGFYYRAHTSLALPVAAKELSFIAEGTNAYGSFEVSQDAGPALDKAIVDIEVEYRISDALDDATVCRTHVGEDKWGLGIFTPRWQHPHRERQLRFFVHVHLPASDNLAIERFSTDLPIFKHHFTELANTVYFEDLSLKSSNSPIEIDSLTGNHVLAKTSNAPIRGKFNTSTTLELYTGNAPISAETSLVNGDGDQPTSLVLKTSNARIDSVLHLRSNTSAASGGKYDVVAHTSNSPLAVLILDAPIGHTLALDGRTSNAAGYVSLHKTFEGSFDLQTSSWIRPSIEWNQGAEDPAGAGRTRHVGLRTARGGSVHGNTWWDEARKDEGTVKVSTSNAPLRLQL